MATSETGGAVASPAPPRSCTLLQVYLRDVSFEAPGVPGVLFGHDRPDLEFAVVNDYSLSAEASTKLGDVYAVNVRITVRARNGDKALFLIEVEQGGLFEVKGYERDELDSVLRITAPEAIYPYARELVSSLVSRAGFPRLQLRPFEFDGGLARALQEERDVMQAGAGSA